MPPPSAPLPTHKWDQAWHRGLAARAPSTPLRTSYNTMIYPLLVGPLSIKGILWYQGENNVYEGGKTVLLYLWC